jgi:hypothetical protein
MFIVLSFFFIKKFYYLTAKMVYNKMETRVHGIAELVAV